MESPNRGSGRFDWTKALFTKRSHFLLVSVLGLFAAGVIAAGLVALILTPTLPDISGLADPQFKVPMRVYTQDGMLMAEFGEEKRIPVKIDQVPDLLKKAILAAEDDSFYFHQGVDFLGIIRAALADLRYGGAREGASTITMQVARNFFLSPKKTYTRKLKEILLALKIERELTKDQILELYINKIFLGNRAYGFAAAAQVYFGKTLQQLTLPEMAVLAGLPKAPSRDNPLNSPQNALVRREYVLHRMLKLGYIDQQTYDEARATPIDASPHEVHDSVEAPYVAEMVRQYMYQTYKNKIYNSGFTVYTTINSKDQQAAEKALHDGLLDYERRHGYRGPVAHESISTNTDHERLDDILKDYDVTADLVPAIVTGVQDQSAQVYTQDGATLVIPWAGLSWARHYIDENSAGPAPQNAGDVVRVGDVVYVQLSTPGQALLAQVPRVSGALVSMRPSDGAILALAGGFDFYQSKFNRATQAQRQPGSSIKPFIYAAALDKGFTPASLVSGAPIVVHDASLEGEWRPENYEREFTGPTRLRKALTLSLNLVSVRLLREIGVDYAIGYLQRFGFTPQQLPRNLSLALGTASVTPLQMATAYSVFANGGFRVQPYFISRIEDADHHVLEQTNPAVACPTCPDTSNVQASAPPVPVPVSAAAAPATGPNYAPRVISPQVDFLMTSMMQDVVTVGTGKRVAELGRHDLAGKTGTTNDQRDAWFSGYNPDVVATAWVGYDQPATLGRYEVGGSTAAPIWIDYMRTALQGIPDRPVAPPPGIVQATINKETGKLTDATDPKAMQEYFVQGTLPAQTDSNGGATQSPQTGSEGLF